MIATLALHFFISYKIAIVLELIVLKDTPISPFEDKRGQAASHMQKRFMLNQKTILFENILLLQKKLHQTQYRIRIMNLSQLVAEQKFSMMQQEFIEIIKILTATINGLSKAFIFNRLQFATRENIRSRSTTGS